MSQVNPFAAAIMASPVVQQQQSADKTRQVRREQAQKAASVPKDTFEHAVENTEDATAIHEQERRGGQDRKGKKRQPAKPDESPESHPSIDVTA